MEFRYDMPNRMARLARAAAQGPPFRGRRPMTRLLSSCAAAFILLSVSATSGRRASGDGGASAADAPPPSASALQACSQTSVALTPLSDLTTGSYQGEPGGLYPGRSNVMPAAHRAAGIELARRIEPLDAAGRPDAAGRYAFVSIGMSNTTQEFSAFVPLARTDPARDTHLAVVDGAQGGQTASAWSHPACPCWTVLEQRLAQAGVSSGQVVAVWVKLANPRPSEGWPAHARQLKDQTVIVLRHLAARFPNLRLAYLSSRLYAGYATTPLNPEPYAYQSAFSVRWAIEDQIANAPGLRFSGPDAEAPWMAWGPYLWADGLRARADGLIWACGDLQPDGTHPSPAGRQKVARMLLDFVHTDPTAREWYLR
jgi:hypothetical protein